MNDKITKLKWIPLKLLPTTNLIFPNANISVYQSQPMISMKDVQ